VNFERWRAFDSIIPATCRMVRARMHSLSKIAISTLKMSETREEQDYLWSSEISPFLQLTEMSLPIFPLLSADDFAAQCRIFIDHQTALRDKEYVYTAGQWELKEVPAPFVGSPPSGRVYGARLTR
jgi:hypothetical protein